MNEWLEGVIGEDEKGGVHGQAFADDQVVLFGGVSAKEVEKIRERWETKGWMVYNESKTNKAMFIASGGKIRPPVVRLGEGYA